MALNLDFVKFASDGVRGEGQEGLRVKPAGMTCGGECGPGLEAPGKERCKGWWGHLQETAGSPAPSAGQGSSCHLHQLCSSADGLFRVDFQRVSRSVCGQWPKLTVSPAGSV